MDDDGDDQQSDDEVGISSSSQQETLTSFPFHYTTKIRLPTPKIAQLIADVLQVDKEYRKSNVMRVVKVEEMWLIVTYGALDLRILRLSLNGFFEALELSMKTISMFEGL